jgi:hypothetical protein
LLLLVVAVAEGAQFQYPLSMALAAADEAPQCSSVELAMGCL